MTDTHVTLPFYMGLKQCVFGPMMYFKNDRYLGRLLDQTGDFGAVEKELFSALVSPPGTVLDIGANIGAFTIPLAKMMGPASQVYAFEPQTDIYRLLMANIAMNGLENVFPIWSAVGSEQGTATIQKLDKSVAVNNFGSARLNEGGEACTLVNIDALPLTNIQFIKIDVEGSEPAVLKGATETLAAQQPALFIENDRTENSAEIYDILRGLGYRMWWHFAPLTQDNSILFPEDQHGSVIQSIDILCMAGGSPPSPLMEVEGNETWPVAYERFQKQVA